jgi:YVTN family beta-propeller protein
VTLDGAFVYVANNGSANVSVIATATNAVIATVGTGGQPVALGKFIGPPAATVTITATDSSAAEAGPDPGVFTVTRTGDTTNALTVNFTVGGTASAGTDYGAIGTSVLIPGGASSGTITITPIADTLNESSETVILTLASGTGYSVGNPSTATVNIANYTGGLLRGQPQVNFGNVKTGSTANRPLDIVNGSKTESLVVRVNSPTPNPPFSLVSGGGTVVIAPGGTLTVTLRFAPTTAGNPSGSLLINSTDSAIPSKNVTLAGMGR